MALSEEKRRLLEAVLGILKLPEPLVKVIKILPEVISPRFRPCRVLILASMIDNALEQLLRFRFTQTSGVDDKECDFWLRKQPVSPLGGFVFKARMAWVLGLITRRTYVGIEYISKSRNGEYTGSCTVITEEMGEQLLGIAFASEDTARIAEYLKVIESYVEQKPCTKFLACCFFIWALVLERTPQFVDEINRIDMGDLDGKKGQVATILRDAGLSPAKPKTEKGPTGDSTDDPAQSPPR